MDCGGPVNIPPDEEYESIQCVECDNVLDNDYVVKYQRAARYTALKFDNITEDNLGKKECKILFMNKISFI